MLKSKTKSGFLPQRAGSVWEVLENREKEDESA